MNNSDCILLLFVTTIGGFIAYRLGYQEGFNRAVVDCKEAVLNAALSKENEESSEN